MNHALNYERVLPFFGMIFALASLAGIVLFVYYSIEWANSNNPTKEGVEFLRADYSYEGAVLALLSLIVFFNGYHLAKLA